MILTSVFDNATTPQVKAMFGLDLDPDQKHMLLVIEDVKVNPAEPSNKKHFAIIPYDDKTTPLELMNKIGELLVHPGSEAFDQRQRFGDDWDKYNLSLFDLPTKEVWMGANGERHSDEPDPHASRICELWLTDYLLPNQGRKQTEADIRNRDHFMRILDRDKMAHQVMVSLHTLLDPDNTPLKQPEYKGLPYQKYFRIASHPDEQWRSQHSQQPVSQGLVPTTLQ